jgi:hypothetical protein
MKRRLPSSAQGLNIYRIMQPSQKLRERARAAGINPNNREAVMELFWSDLRAKAPDPTWRKP